MGRRSARESGVERAMWICSKCDARVDPDFDSAGGAGRATRGRKTRTSSPPTRPPPIEDPTDYLRLDVGKLAEEELPGPPLELAACFLPILAEAKFVSDLLAAEGIPSVLENTAPPGGWPRIPRACIPAGSWSRPRTSPGPCRSSRSSSSRKRAREARGRLSRRRHLARGRAGRSR